MSSLLRTAAALLSSSEALKERPEVIGKLGQHLSVASALLQVCTAFLAIHYLF